MKKSSVSSNSLRTFLSPGPLSYHDGGQYGSQKGWSSERVPHPSVGVTGSSRRQIGSASAINTPFYSGRALPSKWEDAERWICSPVGLYPGALCKHASPNHNFPEHRRPKSKSGPVVPPSPTVQAQPGLMVGSPFSTGVLEADRVFRGNPGAGNGNENAWSDLGSEASTQSSQDDEARRAEIAVSPVVISRRDMATQMSPRDSPNQSPLLLRSVMENQSKTEVREVQVDKRANVIKRPKKHSSRTFKRGPPPADDAYTNSPSASASAWDVSGSALTISTLQREEAKISAWENLQKAKAEAAIRKLEVKLEKKKSESMDKILNKLRKSQLKAQEMRDSMSNQPERKSGKIVPFSKHSNTLLGSLTSCFTQHGIRNFGVEGTDATT